jgi:cyclopropane-fatty-acyl-phospholipid synthase
MMANAKKILSEFLKPAGIEINGNQPWDIQVHNDLLYTRILHQGSLALGETYVEGWWDCEQLDELYMNGFRKKLDKSIKSIGKWQVFTLLLKKLNFVERLIINHQSKKKSLNVGKVHYDVGNKLYQAMLDKEMTYTCGYWKDADSLDSAQLAKLKLVCDKLDLKPGQKILDIGCGWGSFARYAAKNYGVSVVGITISAEQVKLAKVLCADLPIEIRFQDYRDINEQFDHIVSLGMFEHVGYKNYKDFFKVVKRCLKDEGLFCLHTIGQQTNNETDPWIKKYIFPNGELPSLSKISSSIQPYFILEDLHNFGADYDKTLIAWFNNFDENWNLLKRGFK